jgi:hypothetical protein
VQPEHARGNDRRWESLADFVNHRALQSECDLPREVDLHSPGIIPNARAVFQIMHVNKVCVTIVGVASGVTFRAKDGFSKSLDFPSLLKHHDAWAGLSSSRLTALGQCGREFEEKRTLTATS